ncbi:MAG TPA: class I SAM-dependent methyltransferase [Herpetosiphonaceae bacterium]
MSYAQATHWDTYFGNLQQAGQDLDWNEQWTNAFIPILHHAQAQSVLDLGCGTGNDTRRLACAGFTVTGLDYSRQALRAAQHKQLPNSSFVLADMAHTLPFRSARFDGVMANVSLHMFNDTITRQLFADIRRIVRPQGVFVFHVNALEDRPLRAKRKPVIEELEPNYVREADGQTMHFFSEDYLRDLLRNWSDVKLEFLTIQAHTRTEWRKCAWRGQARVP